MKQKEKSTTKLEKKENEKNEKKEVDEKSNKGISQDTLKKIFINVLQAIGIIAYFSILNLVYLKVEQENILNIIEICSGILLLIGIIFLEISYKRDNLSTTITSIEFLVLAFHSLSIKYVITRYDYQLQFYLLTSSYIIAIYYILKAIILYTKGRKEYLNKLSDISEILKKDEPQKKEAKKKNDKEAQNVTIVQKPKTINKRKPKKKKIVEENNKELKTRSQQEEKNSKKRGKKYD